MFRVINEESRKRLEALRQKMAGEQKAPASAELSFEERALREVSGIARLIPDLQHVSYYELHTGILLVDYVRGDLTVSCLYVDYAVVVRKNPKHIDWLHMLSKREDAEAYIAKNFALPEGDVIVLNPVEKRLAQAS